MTKDDQFYELYSRRKNVLEQISSNAYKKKPVIGAFLWNCVG
jgi:hypothetical protein